MLGTLTFETPNVIDPGDLPPSRPSRSASSQDDSASPSNSSNSSPEQEARESANRLLNDISDLELSKPTAGRTILYRDFPSQKLRQAYSPYGDDSENAGEYGGEYEEQNLHSLPHAEEAKSMLTTLSRTRKLSAPRITNKRSNENYYSNPIIHRCCLIYHRLVDTIRRQRPCTLILLAFVIIGFTIGLALVATKNKRNSNSLFPDSDKPLQNYMGTDDYQKIQDFLVEYGISELEQVETKGSPQNTAINWMLGRDSVQYPLPTDDPSSRFLQRYGLLVFYFATNDFDDSTPHQHQQIRTWTHTYSFTTNQDECGWNEVVNTAEYQYLTEELAYGVSCNENLQVTSLFLPHNGLSGSIPRELGLLSDLQLLGLQDNRLNAGIPDTLDHLSNLIYANLNNNTIQGTVPYYLGDFTHLQVLGLAQNQFTGEVPHYLMNANELKTVALSWNEELTGTLDFAQSLSKLEYFYADHCQFTGIVENNFFQNMGELRELDLSHNHLQGLIPVDILYFEHNLQVIDLSYNSFTGSLQDVSTGNVVLHYLSLRNNNLSGSIPPSIANLIQLKHLDLSGNAFTGPIPNSLGSMVSLTYLYLGHNDFGNDTLLPPLNQLVNVRELSLADMELHGPIPNWLVFMKELQMLDLSHNFFTGTIPSAVWNLPSLYFLLLQNNNLVGPLPDSGGEQLDVVAIQHNDIVQDDGVIDQSLCGDHMVIEVAITDCSAGCTNACCGQCCQPDDDDCAKDIVGFYNDGLDFTGSFFAFDPDILDEAGLFGTYEIDEEESDSAVRVNDP